jgi:uncharacterized protein DUF3237
VDVRATIETKDGRRIAVHVDGVATPRGNGPIVDVVDGVATFRANEPIVDVLENVRLTTAAPSYAWVNMRQIWGLGTINLPEGRVYIEGYMQ